MHFFLRGLPLIVIATQGTYMRISLSERGGVDSRGK